jgi:ATP-dependent HslUV protease ATP-binding subunit HslU
MRILREPEGALLKQYTALLASDAVRLEVSDDAVQEIAEVAFRANESTENIGARRLQTVLAALLEPWMYDVPDEFTGDHLEVTAETVRERLRPLLADEDVRQYIL